MLKRLSNRTHQVYTGYAVIHGDKTVTGCEITSVTFRALDDREIEDYIATGEPFDKAGAYGIQGRGCVFVSRIEGDFFNVAGLPICRINLAIKSMQVAIIDYKLLKICYNYIDKVGAFGYN